MTDTPTPDPEEASEAARELAALVQQVDDLSLELRARGAQIPLFPVRLEALIDFLIPFGTPERTQFELHFRRRHIALLKEGIAAATREQLMRGVRGGNGHTTGL